ncbi:FecR family protein [Reyranella sp.]|uniref:FecR family protein n=1 Tax=Reyranella sp. TaxID=1929291 RepID=UPI003C7A3513
MAVTTEADRERASDEAAEWLVRLREAPDDQANQARFAAWRAAAPVHEAAWTEISQAFELIGEPLARRPQTSSESVPRLRRKHVPGLLAAGIGIALAASAAMLFLPGWMLRLEADFATAAGEWREVTLADGSSVELAPLSGIDVSLKDGRREVRLLAGKAFFRVTPDPERPFQVEARNVRATVLGTEFEVSLDRTGTGVAVAEGRVRVDGGALSRVLAAGRWLQFDAAGGLRDGIRSESEIGLWRHGEIVAHDQLIAAVVNELRPYFNGVIVIASDAIARRRVTGVYRLREPVEALRALARAHGDISVTQVSPWLVIVSAD